MQFALAAVSVTASEPVVVQRSVPRGPKQSINGVAPLVPVALGDALDAALGGAVEDCANGENC